MFGGAAAATATAALDCRTCSIPVPFDCFFPTHPHLGGCLVSTPFGTIDLMHQPVSRKARNSPPSPSSGACLLSMCYGEKGSASRPSLPPYWSFPSFACSAKWASRPWARRRTASRRTARTTRCTRSVQGSQFPIAHYTEDSTHPGPNFMAIYLDYRTMNDEATCYFFGKLSSVRDRQQLVAIDWAGKETK